MKTFVLGDIHGAHKALEQVLKKSKFNGKTDRLITLGDIADGWPDTPQCVETLLALPNTVHIRGNHDDWTYQWLKFGIANSMWTSQGGQATLDAYDIYYSELKLKHEQLFFYKQLPYFIDEDNRCYVHGGFNRHEPIADQNTSILMWDRDLFMAAMSSSMRSKEDQAKHPFKIEDKFKEIFIGHTTTSFWKVQEPINAPPIWNLDTGAGFKGVLTLMDVDTKEYWQSDKVSKLYPGVQHR